MQTLVVDFGASDSGQAAAFLELDDTRNLDDDGSAKSQFYPGEQVWIRLHHDSGYTPVAASATDGGADLVDTVTITVTEELYFEQPLQEDGSGEVSLKYRPAGGLSVVWQGNQGVGLQYSGQTAWITSGAPCLAQVSYPVTFVRILYTPPALELAEGDQRQIMVRATLEAVA